MQDIRYEFVTTSGQWLGDLGTTGRGPLRVWREGDTLVTEGPPGRTQTWVAVKVEGLRVTFAPTQARP